jgi:hypothetical protein
MACATVATLLLHQNSTYKIPIVAKDYSACTRSMYARYLKRLFIIGRIIVYSQVVNLLVVRILVQWLPTLGDVQWNDLQSNYEQYVNTRDQYANSLIF